MEMANTHTAAAADSNLQCVSFWLTVVLQIERLVCCLGITLHNTANTRPHRIYSTCIHVYIMLMRDSEGRKKQASSYIYNVQTTKQSNTTHPRHLSTCMVQACSLCQWGGVSRQY